MHRPHKADKIGFPGTVGLYELFPDSSRLESAPMCQPDPLTKIASAVWAAIDEPDTADARMLPRCPGETFQRAGYPRGDSCRASGPHRVSRAIRSWWRLSAPACSSVEIGQVRLFGRLELSVGRGTGEFFCGFCRPGFLGLFRDWVNGGICSFRMCRETSLKFNGIGRFRFLWDVGGRRSAGQKSEKNTQ